MKIKILFFSIICSVSYLLAMEKNEKKLLYTITGGLFKDQIVSIKKTTKFTQENFTKNSKIYDIVFARIANLPQQEEKTNL